MYANHIEYKTKVQTDKVSKLGRPPDHYYIGTHHLERRRVAVLNCETSGLAPTVIMALILHISVTA
jgi:hypothetical protein